MGMALTWIGRTAESFIGSRRTWLFKILSKEKTLQMTGKKWYSTMTLATLAIVWFIAGLLPASARAAGKSPFIVDAAWVSAHGGKVLVVDVRDMKDYLKGHISGSINIPVNDLQTKPDAIMFPVPREEILSEKGLKIDSDVVLAGAGREMAYLEFWMLDYLGMPGIHVLNGGIEEWKGQLTTKETKLPPAEFKARPNPSKYATTAYVHAHLHKAGIVLLDVRTPENTRGRM